MDIWIQNVAWIGMGLVAASALWLVAVLFFRKFNIEIGTLRPQVMVVLVSLSVVTVWALGNNETHNIATLGSRWDDRAGNADHRKGWWER